MVSLKDIRACVEADFAAYEKFLKTSLSSESNHLDMILDYLFLHRGKGLRPLLALLSSAHFRGGRPVGDASFTAAMVVEMIHTASLVHDDVVDEAYIRHGKATVNALLHSRNAVIVGDFILARAFTTGMASGYYPLIAHISTSMDKLCEGEIAQSRQSKLLEMTRDLYMDIIYKKTASLISTCCTAGAMSVDADHGQVEHMRLYGDHLGLAFQIKDDILDYADTKTGKPSCQDLRERKITLPLLTVLEKSSSSRRKELISLLAGVRNNPSNVDKLRAIVLSEKGIEMASAIMEEHLDQSRAALSTLSDTPQKKALTDLTFFISSRSY